MVVAVVDVYNMAISAARGKGRLATINDGGREAEECTIWYDLVRRQVQSAAHWDCCRRAERLFERGARDFTLQWEDSGDDPMPQYTYAYDMPTGYLHAWNMADYSQFDFHYNSSRAKLFLDSNWKDAVLIYAFDNIDPDQWSTGMLNATVHALAAHISGPLSGQGNLEQLNFQKANTILLNAQAENANNARFLTESIPPALVARGYSEGQAATRYYYPYGKTFEAAAVNV